MDSFRFAGALRAFSVRASSVRVERVFLPIIHFFSFFPNDPSQSFDTREPASQTPLMTTNLFVAKV